MIGMSVIILSVLIIAIWIVIEIKRLKHKLFAIFLIVLILFAYVSVTLTLKNQDIDIKTIAGATSATKIYFSWLINIFGNVKSITGDAIKMDWAGEQNISFNSQE